MRVLLVAGSYPPEQCGVGDYTQKLAGALAEHSDIEIGVLTSAVGNRVAAGRVNLIEVAKQWKFSELPSLIRAIRHWKPDIVHIQYPSQGFFSCRLPSLLPVLYRLMGLRVVQTWHEPHRLRGAIHFMVQGLGANGLIFVRPNYLKLLPPPFRMVVKRRPQVTIPNAGALPVSSLDPDQRSQRRKQHLDGFERLIIFFGFLYPSKGIESLFDIGNSSTDMLVIAGAIKDKAYARQLAELARSKGWADEQVRFTGFLSPKDAADLLAVADAVVLPFLDGGGEWNTSIHSALSQGTLVITTAVPPRGDEPLRNLYTSAPSAVSEMREVLDRLAGRRVAATSTEAQWHEIAAAHLAFYRRCL